MSRVVNKIFSTVSLLITFGVVAGAAATTPSTVGEGLYGCITPKNGNLTRISTTPPTCPANATLITWGARGAQGPIGPQGPTGPQGVKGDTGPQGASGIAGTEGPRGPQGDSGQRGPQGPSWTYVLEDTSGRELLKDVQLFSSESGFGWDADGTMWNFDSNGLAAIAPVGAWIQVFTSTDCSTGRLGYKAKVLTSKFVSKPTIQSQFVALSGGGYFKAEKLAEPPFIKSYWDDGRCKPTSTAAFQSDYSNAFALYQFIRDETYYVDWSFWSLTPTDKPVGQGEARIVRKLR